MRKDKISIQKYNRLHYWLRTKFGMADKCENKKCSGKSKSFEWALKADKSYNFNRDNFITLCRSCHSTQDFTEEGKRRISEYNKKNFPDFPPINCVLCNLRIKKPKRKNQRYCKKCRKIVDIKFSRNWNSANKDYKKRYYLEHRNKYLRIFKERYVKSSKP